MYHKRSNSEILKCAKVQRQLVFVLCYVILILISLTWNPVQPVTATLHKISTATLTPDTVASLAVYSVSPIEADLEGEVSKVEGWGASVGAAPAQNTMY